MSKKSVEFHVENNDYFGTLATVLSLIRQTINQKNSLENNRESLVELEKDLMFLQKEYKIIKN